MRTWLARFLIALAALLLLLVLLLIAAYLFLSTRVNGELQSGGETRRYLLHVPARYDSATPTALVISLHGAYLYPGFQMRLSKWNTLADGEGFLVVYPKAAGLPPLWRISPEEGQVAELQFFEDLIDALSAGYNIDPERIYASGYSNGAAMTTMLACGLAHRIAAVGVVATPVVPWDWCSGSEPVPVLAVHGTADPFVPYEGGENFLTTEPLPSMRAWVAELAARNGCDAAGSESELSGDLSLLQYDGCVKGATVALYTVNGAGHVWPGGLRLPGSGFIGSSSDSFDATAQMWQFFREHPLAP